MPFDPTSFTTPRMLMEMFVATEPSLINRGDPGETRDFTAYALHDFVPLSSKAYEAFSGETSDSNFITQDLTSRYRGYCAISGEDLPDDIPAMQNPHTFNPLCGEDFDAAEAANAYYIQCFTSRDFVISSETYPQAGDKVNIRLTFDDGGNINMETGELISIKERGTKTKDSCIPESLADLFSSAESPQIGDPHPTYPNVEYEEGGYLIPVFGYKWANDTKGDFSVVKAESGDFIEGSSQTMVYNDDMLRLPAPGYDWANDTTGDYSVTADKDTAGIRATPFTAPYGAKVGTPYPGQNNVVWAKNPLNGQLTYVKPAEGYVWSSVEKDNYSVAKGEPKMPDPVVLSEEEILRAALGPPAATAE